MLILLVAGSLVAADRGVLADDFARELAREQAIQQRLWQEPTEEPTGFRPLNIRPKPPSNAIPYAIVLAGLLIAGGIVIAARVRRPSVAGATPLRDGLGAAGSGNPAPTSPVVAPSPESAHRATSPASLPTMVPSAPGESGVPAERSTP